MKPEEMVLHGTYNVTVKRPGRKQARTYRNAVLIVRNSERDVLWYGFALKNLNTALVRASDITKVEQA